MPRAVRIRTVKNTGQNKGTIKVSKKSTNANTLKLALKKANK